MANSTSTTLVRVDRVSPGYDPAAFYRELVYDKEHSIKEIEMIYGESYGGYGITYTMYCFVDSYANAQRLAQTLAGRRHGKSHLSSKMRLSDFLRDEKAMPKTKTVRFDGLPDARRHAIVCELFNESSFALVVDELDPNDWEKSADQYIEHVENLYDSVLVRFKNVQSAWSIVRQYNGTCYKNDTIYLTCVDDDELNGILEEKKAKDKNVMYFIPEIKPGASRQEIDKVFAPHVPDDVQMPPGKHYAFVFMRPNAAAEFMETYTKAIAEDKYKKFRRVGWNWQVNLGRKGNKANRGSAAPSAEFKAVPASGRIDTETYGGYSNLPMKVDVLVNKESLPTPAPATTPAPIQGHVEIRVSGLPYAATEENVHRLFENAQFQVQGTKLDNTYKGNAHAIVKLDSPAEAQRAISTLTGRNLVGRKGPKNLKCKITVLMEST
ncbi:hypothetical protein DPSP01_004210 [Paraphaeosphaeria sporulosa]